jgi:LPXTG-site transpeptidase (sortase) family protein
MLENGLIAPIPQEMVVGMGQMGNGMKAQAATLDAEDDVNEDEPIILADQLDYTNLNNWFPNLTPEQADVLASSEVANGAEVSTEYTLDIPAVKVEDARVKIGGTNLDKNLIQYPGTANPGDPGSPVIFGHSVLRQFYNPSVKNSRRYMSIFSKIMTLKSGDKVYLTRDGVKYSYTVQEKTEVKPEDVFILEQNYESKTLKLITCVPEGTYLRRGVVIATLDTE